MILVKLFATADMPDAVADLLMEIIEIDGTTDYKIGYFVADGCNEMQTVDDWLLSNGAKSDETILIHHGHWVV